MYLLQLLFESKRRSWFFVKANGILRRVDLVTERYGMIGYERDTFLFYNETTNKQTNKKGQGKEVKKRKRGWEGGKQIGVLFKERERLT